MKIIPECVGISSAYRDKGITVVQSYVIGIVKHLRNLCYLVQVDEIASMAAKPALVTKQVFPVGDVVF